VRILKDLWGGDVYREVNGKDEGFPKDFGKPSGGRSYRATQGRNELGPIIKRSIYQKVKFVKGEFKWLGCRRLEWKKFPVESSFVRNF